MGPNGHTESVRKTWFLVLFLLIFILAKGYFAVFVVADRGQPDWDYRPVLDVPAESPYAVYEPMPYPQHIRGAEGR